MITTTAAEKLRGFTRGNNYGYRALKRWQRLDDRERHDIERRFKRHVTACEKLEIDPDPNWLIEAVLDA